MKIQVILSQLKIIVVEEYLAKNNTLKTSLVLFR